MPFFLPGKRAQSILDRSCSVPRHTPRSRNTQDGTPAATVATDSLAGRTALHKNAGRNAGRFHRKPLPEGCLDFGSEPGILLFGRTLAAGGMRTYFALAPQFHTQDDPSFCGLGTLVMVLNALMVQNPLPPRGTRNKPPLPPPPAFSPAPALIGASVMLALRVFLTLPTPGFRFFFRPC